MTNAAAETSILLVDDGELDPVAEFLTSQGLSFERHQGAQIPRELAPPRDLLITSPRRLNRVRRGSPRNAPPGLPLRIIAVDEDTPSVRRRMRSSGAQLLVRLPADDEIWRLLVTRALYRGHERRNEPRVAMGSPIEFVEGAPAQTTLIDLSNRGCRLQTSESLVVDQCLTFTIPPAEDDWDGDAAGLTLRGRVRRIVQESGADGLMVAMTFEDDLSESTRTALARLINRWTSGPTRPLRSETSGAPMIPPCRLRALPDLVLDDETDPPIRSRSEVRVAIDASTHEGAAEQTSCERRSGNRGQFESTVLARNSDGPMVLIGRDLSPGGMRVEAVGALRIGDRFRLALRGPGPADPLVIHAEVVRDDGREGFALAFREVDDPQQRAISKLVDCLPGVASLEDGETNRTDTVLIEVVPD